MSIDDIRLSQKMVNGLNTGRITKIIITPTGKYDQIQVEIVRPEPNRKSDFEYVDVDDL